MTSQPSVQQLLELIQQKDEQLKQKDEQMDEQLKQKDEQLKQVQERLDSAGGLEISPSNSFCHPLWLTRIAILHR